MEGRRRAGSVSVGRPSTPCVFRGATAGVCRSPWSWEQSPHVSSLLEYISLSGNQSTSKYDRSHFYPVLLGVWK